MLKLQHAPGRAIQAGLSIVELLVGVAIGLVVVAAAALLVSGQLVENRRLVIETALQQDLRAVADIITRDIRRVGALPEISQSVIPGIAETMFLEGVTLVQAARNAHYVYPNSTFADRSFSIGGSTGANEVVIPYSPLDAPVTGGYIAGPYGFRRVGDVIKARRPGGSTNWNTDLTDPKLMKVTRLSITEGGPASVATEVVPCPNLCLPGNDTSCWPRVVVRDVTVVIEAEATADPNVKRAVVSRVRLRNDQVWMNPTGGTTYQVCPPPPP
jgi:hypothetical protein